VQTTAQKKKAPIDDSPPIVSAEDSPQDLGLPTPGIDPQARSADLNWHVTSKVRATQPFVLDNTILHASVRRSLVDSFKNQKKSTAISPDNLKKSAIHHFPSTVSYSSNVAITPGKSCQLAEKKVAGARRNIITQESDAGEALQDASDDDNGPTTRNLYKIKKL
jgi:hypothetical protein